MSLELRRKMREERGRIHELLMELVEVHDFDDRAKLEHMMAEHERNLENYQQEIADEWRKRKTKAPQDS